MRINPEKRVDRPHIPVAYEQTKWAKSMTATPEEDRQVKQIMRRLEKQLRSLNRRLELLSLREEERGKMCIGRWKHINKQVQKVTQLLEDEVVISA